MIQIDFYCIHSLVINKINYKSPLQGEKKNSKFSLQDMQMENHLNVLKIVTNINTKCAKLLQNVQMQKLQNVLRELF